MMPLAGTFAYVAVVPPGADGRFDCEARLSERMVPTGDTLTDARLVGHRPWLRVEDAGLTPDPGPDRPRVFRSRIHLRAASRAAAMVPEAWFHIDRSIASALRPGDVVHLARTVCGGVGMSVLRGDGLVVALGALLAVPTGPAVGVRHPREAIAIAEAAFQAIDPGFTLHAAPLEIRVGGQRTLLPGSRDELGAYRLHLLHGDQAGLPGTDAHGAIAHRGWCPRAGVMPSVELLSADGVAFTRW